MEKSILLAPEKIATKEDIAFIEQKLELRDAKLEGEFMHLKWMVRALLGIAVTVLFKLLHN